MSYEYSEDVLIQQTASNFLRDNLGWESIYAFNSETFGNDGTLGRENEHEILLTKYLYPALKRLNSWIDNKGISEVKHKLMEHLSMDTPMQINEQKYFLIRDGVPIDVIRKNGKKETKRAMIIDFNNVNNNSFLAVRELNISGSLYRRRADLIGFVNGIPLVFMEFKKPSIDIKSAYDNNYTDYQESIPQLFYFNAFSILSNGIKAKVGTLGSKYEFFSEWKRLAEKDEGKVSLEIMLRGICQKENLLDLLENFILFDHAGGHTVKILARNHQYLGVNEALKAYEGRKLNKGKLGVFWHTQGSGKSYSMIFLAKKIRRKYAGSPTIVILTDRDELNKQISDTFQSCNLLGSVKASQFMTTSGIDLINKLKGNPSFIFTLIQKFNMTNIQPIYPDHDIIIMSDEAHRSQYGIFAENMCKLLPTALKIGFTGTPLLSDDNITERTFGKYISIYDFNRAIEDGATVPLYYENRGEKILHIQNPEINERILEAIERADVDEKEQKRLEREFSKEIHILTTENRLKAIAKDFVKHYSDLWTSGKAMFVCLNKVTCVRMYNLVQFYWQEEIRLLKTKINQLTQQEAQELHRKLQWMQETDMAVVVSQEQNEIQNFAKWGLDIKVHREKMIKRDLAKEFKDMNNPFRIVFVCAMWLTGFDVKCLSCLYLDKPLKAHTLMQTIARANRVSEGKSNGLIIDYIGIVKALKKALADYTTNSSKHNIDPIIDKSQLINKLLEAINLADSFLIEENINIDKLIKATGFEKLDILQNATNAIYGNDSILKNFKTCANRIIKIMKYVDRDDISDKIRDKQNAIVAIYSQLTKSYKHTPNVDLQVEVNNILNEYIVIEEKTSYSAENKKFNISKIDFDLLDSEFSNINNKNLILRDLKSILGEKITKMVAINPIRINYYERYQKIIDDYNREQDQAIIEKTFMDLMDLVKDISNEQERYIKEGLKDDEELAIFDLLLCKDLSSKDIRTIKKISSELLTTLKEKIAEFDHWQDKEDTCANINNTIKTYLWENLPENYDIDTIPIYQQQIYEYVYSHYGN